MTNRVLIEQHQGTAGLFTKSEEKDKQKQIRCNRYNSFSLLGIALEKNSAEVNDTAANNDPHHSMKGLPILE